MICLMIVSMFLGVACLGACAAYGMKKLADNPLELHVRRVLIAALAVVGTNALAMLVPNKTISLILFSVYNILETLAAIALLSYVRKYISKNNGLGRIRPFVWAASAVDFLLMIINIFRPVTYTVDRITDVYGYTVMHVASSKLPYYFHTLLLLAISSVAMGLLLRRILTASKSYIFKYTAILAALTIVVALGTFTVFWDFNFDYSILFYPILGSFIFYYTLIYMSRGITESLMFFTVSNMKDGVICIDIDNKVVHANPPAKSFCEADADILTIEEQVRKWQFEFVDPNLDAQLWSVKRRINGSTHNFSIEYQRNYDSFAKHIGSSFLIHDRTDEDNKLAEQRHRATHDKLTGLYNQEYFNDRVCEILNKDTTEKYCIVVTDVKNFKLVNDVFGTETGNKLLCKIAELISKFGGSNCVYARLTGDRFAMFMPRYRFSEEKMLETFSPIDSFIQHSNFKVHIHIGVYDVLDRTLRPLVMCDRANLAIKTIKDSFKSHVAYYNSQLREDFIGAHQIISDFEFALANGQFRPYIQPQIAADGSIRGGEELVRWLHPSEGMIPPSKFIQLLERTGLISRLDRYMWDIACQTLKRWSDNGFKKSYISINISQKDFYLLDVYEVITSLVEQYGIQPKRLHLEITETAVMDNNEHLALISRLRSYGFIVEIDDFGSGYSSLNMLKELEADVLKIDMGFLQKSENESAKNSEKSKKILEMIIKLAKSLDMEVITEGVELKEHVLFLEATGCDIYQGFYFAKPMPLNEFESGYLNKRFRMK